MNRRHFLTATGAAAASAPLGALAEAIGDGDNPRMDPGKVRKVDHYIAICERATDGSHPNIRLEVRLEKKDPEDPWSAVIRLFKLTWNGAEIPVQKRFWDDLSYLLIEVYPDAERLKTPEDKRGLLDRELSHLSKPRLIRSADGGTVLIEWTLPAECDSRTTLRWIISKTGTVLRHRYEPFHEC